MARINGRYEPQAISPMESEAGGGSDFGGGSGGSIGDLYATLGSRVADLPGFGTMWGSFAELGEMQYEGALAERRTIPEAADAAPLAAEATSSSVPQLPDSSGHALRLTPPLSCAKPTNTARRGAHVCITAATSTAAIFDRRDERRGAARHRPRCTTALASDGARRKPYS